MSTPPPPPSGPRAPVKGVGVSLSTTTTARRAHTIEIRKAKRGSALMRRRIGVEGGETGDETGTDTEGGEGMDEETGGMGGVYGPADAKVRKKGIDWNLRLTEAFSAYLTPVPPEEEGLDKLNKRLVHRKLDASIMEVYLSSNPLLLGLLLPKLLIHITTATDKVCTCLSNLLYCLHEDTGNYVISATAHVVKEYMDSPAALITLGNMTTNPYGRDLLTRNGTLEVVSRELSGAIKGRELQIEGLLWTASNLARTGECKWLEGVNWKELQRITWMGLHGYETSRGSFKELAWLSAFAVARGGGEVEEEIWKFKESFVGYVCGKGVEEDFAIPCLRVIGNLGVNLVQRREIVKKDREERDGRFWAALLEIGTRPGIRKEVWWCLGNFIDEATTEFKTEALNHVVEAGWVACLGSVSTSTHIPPSFPTKLNDSLRDSQNLDDVVNCVKIAKVMTDRQGDYYNEIDEGLERVVEWGYGKGERGEWCCEVASDIIDNFTEMHEHEVDGMAPSVGSDGMFAFGSNSTTAPGASGFNLADQGNAGGIGGMALDSYGPRKDLKGRGRGVVNKPAWIQDRERKGLKTYDFVKY